MAVDPSIDYLAYAEEHLYYEARMFVSARSAVYEAFADPTANTFHRNALLEVSVLHLRNLILFFYPSQPKPSDVTAKHYVDSWNDQCPLPLDKARRRANKELAHLTAERKAGTPPDKAWDFRDLSAELRKTVAGFIGSANGLPARTLAELRKI